MGAEKLNPDFVAFEEDLRAPVSASGPSPRPADPGVPSPHVLDRVR